MKLAVMQPYSFPYIGYFQLLNSVDYFVFYDDVNYIKRGWINRNRILVNGDAIFLTIPCNKASQNKEIQEVTFDPNRPEIKKIKKTIVQAYGKAPHFEQVNPLINTILDTPTHSIAVLAEESIKKISEYLGINTKYYTSSKDFGDTKDSDRADRLIQLCERTNCSHYVNPVGGMEIYDKNYFRNQGVDLQFLKPKSVEYQQFTDRFIPWLSIIDVLMFNSVDEIQKMLTQYELL